MKADSVKLSREQLYEEVWTTPIHRLSGKYGLSDVGLAKVCRRMDIPRPPRGYWARLKWGAKLKRTPLPAPGGRTQREVEFRPRSEPPPPRQAPKPPRIPKLALEVPAVLSNPHPLVATTQNRFAAAKQNPQGLLVVKAQRVLDIEVGPANLDRCLRFLDALIKSWEAEGLVVKMHKPDGDSSPHTCLCRGDERLTLSVRETVEEIDPGPTEEEKLLPKWQWKPRKEYRPTGKLTLFMAGGQTSWSTKFHRRHEDAEGLPIEDKLKRIWQAGVEYFEKREAYETEQERQRIRWEAQQRRWEIERKREEAARRRREEEERRIADFKRSAADWETARHLRDFVKACRVRLESRGLDEQAIEHWCRWAMAIADHVDPLENDYLKTVKHSTARLASDENDADCGSDGSNC